MKWIGNKILKSKLISIGFLLLMIINIVNNLEFKKSKNIKVSEKAEQGRVLEIEDESILENKINLKKSNFLVVFYAEWCAHCKDFLSILDEASKFTLTKKFDFLRVNCANEKLKKVCEANRIDRYPTTKVYLKGEETSFVPVNRDLESIVEYIDKLNSESVKEIKTQKEFLDYSKNYGDVSFLLVDQGELDEFALNEDNKNLKMQLLKCYEDIAEYYKPLFYFAYMEKNKFRNYYNIKLPAIVNLGLNEEFNIHLSFSESDNIKGDHDETSSAKDGSNSKSNNKNMKNKESQLCSKMKKFVELNKFPVLKKLDQTYLTKMQRERRSTVIAALNRRDNQHISFLNNYFHYFALENRENYTFTYLDFKEDKYFFDFFNIDLSKFSDNYSRNKKANSYEAEEFESDLKPILIVYNFKINKYFVDPDSFSEEKNYLKISDKKQLKNILERIEAGKIRWTSGYLLEDIFTDLLGPSVSREKLLMIYSGIFFLIMGLIMIFVCSCFCEEKGKNKKIKKGDKVKNKDKGE